MPQRNCTKTKAKVVISNKRITLPVSMEAYQEIVGDCRAYRKWVDEMMSKYPELFPPDIVGGYRLHDGRTSEKMEGVRLRRISLNIRDSAGKEQVFTIAPSSVLPYFAGLTDDVEKALFFPQEQRDNVRRFDVPFWALAYVFGRDDKYWYRQESQFGRYSIVQTVVKDPEKLPIHLLADEKITRLNGEKVVVATTVGEDCVLGASVALNADEENLTEAYRHFKEEAQTVKANYAPETVNTDGWSATQRAWLNLFPLVVLIECFLHAFIKIRERGKHLKVSLILSQQVWDVYRAADVSAFRLKATGLQLWAEQHTTGYVLEAVRKLCAKTERFALAYDHPLVAQQVKDVG